MLHISSPLHPATKFIPSHDLDGPIGLRNYKNKFGIKKPRRLRGFFITGVRD
jgi:hypothetical protein